MLKHKSPEAVLSPNCSFLTKMGSPGGAASSAPGGLLMDGPEWQPNRRPADLPLSLSSRAGLSGRLSVAWVVAARPFRAGVTPGLAIA